MIALNIFLSLFSMISGLFLCSYLSEKIPFDKWYCIPVIISAGMATFAVTMFFVFVIFLEVL